MAHNCGNRCMRLLAHILVGQEIETVGKLDAFLLYFFLFKAWTKPKK